MYDYLDDRQTKRLKELVPYEVLAPDADEIIEELERLNNIILNQQKRIDKTIQAIDEILIYNDLSDTTSAFGNAPRELKFYLSECDTLEELKENNK